MKFFENIAIVRSNEKTFSGDCDTQIQDEPICGAYVSASLRLDEKHFFCTLNNHFEEIKHFADNFDRVIQFPFCCQEYGNSMELDNTC